MLLCCIQTPTGKLRVRQNIDLYHLSIFEDTDLPGNSFSVRGRQKVLDFQAPNQEEMTLWISSIRSAVDEFEKKRGKIFFFSRDVFIKRYFNNQRLFIYYFSYYNDSHCFTSMPMLNNLTIALYTAILRSDTGGRFEPTVQNPLMMLAVISLILIGLHLEMSTSDFYFCTRGGGGGGGGTQTSSVNHCCIERRMFSQVS